MKKADPTIYAQVLYKLYEDNKISSALKLFVQYLAKKNKLYLLPKIKEKFVKIYNEKKKIVEVKIESAYELDLAQKEKIYNFIAGRKPGYKINALNVVDSSLIGGVRIFIDDTLYDGSLKKTINNLKDTLISN